jgi:hypothetical protein
MFTFRNLLAAGVFLLWNHVPGARPKPLRVAG